MYSKTLTFIQRLKKKLLYKSLLEGKCLLGTGVEIESGCRFECPENMSLGDKVRVHSGSILIAPPSERLPRDRQLRIGANAYVGHNCFLDSHQGFIDIGEESGFSPFCILYGHGGITIGRKVVVGPRTTFIAANHVFSDPRTPISEQGENYAGITVEDDVWIGGHCLILDGVRIGSHSVVAGGSVVTRDVPPNTLVAGVPAKVIKK